MDTGGPRSFTDPDPDYGVFVTVTLLEATFPSWTSSRAAFAGTVTVTVPSVAGVTSNVNVTLSCVTRFDAVPLFTDRADAVSPVTGSLKLILNGIGEVVLSAVARIVTGART